MWRGEKYQWVERALKLQQHCDGQTFSPWCEPQTAHFGSGIVSCHFSLVWRYSCRQCCACFASWHLLYWKYWFCLVRRWKKSETSPLHLHLSQRKRMPHVHEDAQLSHTVFRNCPVSPTLTRDKRQRLFLIWYCVNKSKITHFIKVSAS